MSSIYETHQLGSNCWRIEDNGVRAFLVAGTEKAVLIDSGFGSGNIRAIAEGLTNHPIMLVNTHADRDHIGCNSLFEKAYMHPSEYERYSLSAGLKTAPEPLWEGDKIVLGNRSLEVLLISGHTPGSIALLDHENRILFGGDSVQGGTIYMFGPGRNMNAYIESMIKLLTLSSQFDIVYAAHGPIPVKSDILVELINGARRILKGEIIGIKSTRAGVAALEYDVGVAKFLF